MEHDILDLLKRSAAIPSMPQVATRFLEIVQDPDFDYADVVEVLSTDPGTASEILRLANSSLFGVTRQVTSLAHALTLLGLRRVRSLVLGRYIVESIDIKNTSTLDTSYYWRRSLATAVLAAKLADALAPNMREEAFISGLLADVGVVILNEVVWDRYRTVAQQYCPNGNPNPAQDEVQRIDIHHGQASALVLEHWQLPEVVCEAVRHHPWEIEQNEPSLLAKLVGSADRLGKYLCERPEDKGQVFDACGQVMERLGLEIAVLAKLLPEIESQIEEFAQVLHIDVIPSQIYQMIADGLRDQLVEQKATV